MNKKSLNARRGRGIKSIPRRRSKFYCVAYYEINTSLGTGLEYVNYSFRRRTNLFSNRSKKKSYFQSPRKIRYKMIFERAKSYSGIYLYLSVNNFQTWLSQTFKEKRESVVKCHRSKQGSRGVVHVAIT